ncbi:unnamed protein product [Adineta steineri]|uniref:Anoctamin n=3 Tax=Adineta steineri TaxID=433720 RepID=A0A813QP39_9BILA|nr:unnamed protein product [Adineta steineri]
MVVTNANNYNENVNTENSIEQRRQSVLTSSDPNSDKLPIDCILVYRTDDREKDTEVEDNNGHQYVKNKTPFERRIQFEEYLKKKQGLIVEPIESNSEKIGFVRIHAPFEVLLVAAENIRMKLPIEKIEEEEDDSPMTQTNQSTWHSFTKWLKGPFRLDESLKHNDPDYYTAIYSSEIDKFKKLFVKLRGSKDLYFTSTERSILTHELLSRAHIDDDVEGEDTTVELSKSSKRYGIDQLVAKKAYTSYFPLHESIDDKVDNKLNDRKRLKKYWATMRQWYKFQPLSLIRSYMGEKVAFYFALFGFYNQMLILPALVGLIIFIYGISTVFSDKPTSDICGTFGNETNMCPRCDDTCPFWLLNQSCFYSKISYVFDNAATVIFAILMSLWARWFIEFWKRRQAILQYEWDSIDFEQHLEPIRPEFESQATKKGERRLNPVTEITEPYISTQKRIPFYIMAAIVVIIMMAIVCATVFATIVYRVRMDYILKKTSVSSYSSIIITVTSAIMNLICSIILSKFYYWIARKLTNLEFHKYQSTYDDSLVIKIYLFQFVNFYSSLFYIAFFKGRFLEYPSKYGLSNSRDFTEQCDPAGCLVELSIQFVIIMIGKQIINNILEFFNATSRTLMRCSKGHDSNEQNQWEIDSHLFDFKSDILIDEYLELVIQFGFITLFVTAFPLAPLFALFNNLIEIRLDAWKFLSKYKRPIPFKASDIGIWGDIISGISYFAVLTNAIVIAWTSEFIPKMAYRSLKSTGGSLDGYVNWTLSSFPVSAYNVSGVPPPNPPTNVQFCRYRDFRSEDGPLYSQTSEYWNVTAARLAFIIVFEHVIFFIIYLMDWLVPDVPKSIQNKINHERYIDQRERWASKLSEDHLKHAVEISDGLRGEFKIPNAIAEILVNETDTNLNHRPRSKGKIRNDLSSENP